MQFKNLSEAKSFLDKHPDSLNEKELVHCAQSLEYSIAGFPTTKGKLFQKTIGRGVARVFLWRGEMSHDIKAPVPGAPHEEPLSQEQALQRLKTAIETFEKSKEVASHFAMEN